MEEIKMSKYLDLIEHEETRQKFNVELIASENFVSENVLRAMGSVLTNKYAEGYPGNRYYGGCQWVDLIEQNCIEDWKKVFYTDYHVNVQPHSGSQANYAAYAAVLNPGDTILTMSLNNGGHLTHGSPVNYSGKLYKILDYGVGRDGYINMNDVYTLANIYHPKLILAGASAYPRKIDYEKFAHIAHQFDAIFMVDMAHVAGLIAAGEHPSPFGHADIITTTTHKTLRGPRGGIIFCRPDLASKIDSAVFPGSQGGPLENVIAAKGVCAEEAQTADFKSYIHQVVLNSKAMANEFINMGYKLVTGGTDNHMFLVDLTDLGISGLEAQERCDAQQITLNKNCVPNDKRSPKYTSGIRIGTAAMTTKGYKEEDFIRVAHKIDSILKG